jgi:sRNA-binding carbon storage regulator CsrA
MVVLCRRPHQSLFIPSIGARIHVAAVLPDVVRVAIDAPSDVAILPGEASPQSKPNAPAAAPKPGRSSERARAAAFRRLPRPLDRITRRRLRAISVRVGLARLQLQVGRVAAARAALSSIHQEIQGLRRRLEKASGKRRVNYARSFTAFPK